MGQRGTGKRGAAGAGKKDWWPDWRGQTVLIAASGPSQRKEDLQAARGRCKVVVINDTYKLAPWADVLYACDLLWWQKKGADGFAGLKVIGKGEFPGTHTMGVEIVSHMLWHGRAVGGGGNSGFQALNMAVLWGAKRVILTGYDYQDPGNHWFGKHPPGMSQANAGAVSGWLSCMTQEAPKLMKRGVKVINCTRQTALTCFPRMRLQEALRDIE